MAMLSGIIRNDVGGLARSVNVNHPDPSMLMLIVVMSNIHAPSRLSVVRPNTWFPLKLPFVGFGGKMKILKSM